MIVFKPLSVNPTKWSNTLKKIVGNLPTNCLSVFDHFGKLKLKGLTFEVASKSNKRKRKFFKTIVIIIF